MLTGGNRNDVTDLLPLVGSVVPVRHKLGRPGLPADELAADRAYDQNKYRPWAVGPGRQICHRPPRPSTDPGSGAYAGSSSGLRVLHFLRRLRLRLGMESGLHLAFLHFGCRRLTAATCPRYATGSYDLTTAVDGR